MGRVVLRSKATYIPRGSTEKTLANQELMDPIQLRVPQGLGMNQNWWPKTKDAASRSASELQPLEEP